MKAKSQKEQNKKFLKKLKSASLYFRQIPDFTSLNEVLETRKDRINKLIEISLKEDSISSEILRYIPLSVYSLFEYYLKILFYLTCSKSSEIENQLEKKLEESGGSISSVTVDQLDENYIDRKILLSHLSGYKTLPKQLKILCELSEFYISHSESKILNKKQELADLRNLIENNNEIIEFLLKEIRDYFSHNSGIIDLNPRSEILNIRNLSKKTLDVITEINSKIDSIFDGISSVPIKNIYLKSNKGA